jgi:glycosyltransferase involved in cell wall biosynthesis
VKKKYLINSFYFQKLLFEKYLSDYFDFDFSPTEFQKTERALRYVPSNFLTLKKMYWSKKINTYDIVHFNRPEAFYVYKKLPNQLSVFEAHGFDIGVLAELYLKDIHSPWKQQMGRWVDAFLRKKIIKHIKQVDLWYCSTPDMVSPLTEWCGRTPEWLPNPIDIDFFTPIESTKKLEGSPACFLAARLHGDKKPEIAINIFQNYIKPRFKDATLHLIATGELVKKYQAELTDPMTYFWHPYMTKEELRDKLRGADLVFGDFSIGALSMLPLQVMALKKPVITLDKYEVIKKPVEELPEFTLQLLEDAKFRDEWIERCYKHVHEVHGPRAIAERHLANLRRVGYTI